MAERGKFCWWLNFSLCAVRPLSLFFVTKLLIPLSCVEIFLQISGPFRFNFQFLVLSSCCCLPVGFDRRPLLSPPKKHFFLNPSGPKAKEPLYSGCWLRLAAQIATIFRTLLEQKYRQSTRQHIAIHTQHSLSFPCRSCSQVIGFLRHKWCPTHCI